MSYKRNLGTTCLNGFAAILMMGRMLAYAKLLTVPEFGTLSIGLLISASLAMVNAFGLYLLMQRDLPYLFAAGRVTRGMIMMCEVTLVTVLCAVPLLGLSATGTSLAGGAGVLLALAAVHGLTNQLFGIVSTESKSRLLQSEFSVTLFSRSCVVSVTGLLTAVKIGSAEAILVAEILATAVMIGIVTMRAGVRYGRASLRLPVLALRHFRHSEWRAAGALFISVILAFLMQNSDRWLAAGALDKPAFAEFAFAWTLLSMASTFQVTVNANLFPSLAAQIYHQGAQAVRERTGKTSLGFLLVLGVLAVPGYLMIRWGIGAYFPQYLGVLAYIPLFLAAAAFRASDFWANYFVISGKTRILFACQIAVLLGSLLVWAVTFCYPAMPPLMRLSILTLTLAVLSFCFGFVAARVGGKMK
ncbi:hypothetical protein [Ensifer sp. 2YAB10]|uniref:hypothetical protein n=1 Tax=Ensifer sp. 2YAB10 TaxID=3233021 RepID=UPI003F8DE0FE